MLPKHRDVVRRPISEWRGIVNLRRPRAQLPNARRCHPLSPLPFPAQHHQPRGLALLPVYSQLPRRRRPPLSCRPRCRTEPVQRGTTSAACRPATAAAFACIRHVGRRGRSLRQRRATTSLVCAIRVNLTVPDAGRETDVSGYANKRRTLALLRDDNSSGGDCRCSGRDHSRACSEKRCTSLSPEGLSRQAYSKFDTAQMKTAWGRRHQRRFALVDGADVLASATKYDLAAVLDQRSVRVCGIGEIFTQPAHRAGDHARELRESAARRSRARWSGDGASLFRHEPRTPANRLRRGFNDGG